jgi:hypothetical protein
VATVQVYYLLFAAVVLGIAVVAVLLLTLKRLKQRKARLLSELAHSPRLDADRAFNRIEMARREAAIVAHQGLDVSRARDQIAEAQSAMDLRHFDRAYELAQSAHETLVQSRLGRSAPPPIATSDPMSPRGSPRSGVSPPLASSSAAGPTGATPAPVPQLPRGRVEAQFQMHLLASELDAAKARRPTDPATLAGVDFQDKARTAFDAGQYTDALRLALKGRRGLGGHVETVAPTAATRGTDAAAAANDVQAAAESAASATRCPNCGYPTTPSDVFCRGCGTPRTPTACPKCGTARTPTDTFCGRCGERFS